MKMVKHLFMAFAVVCLLSSCGPTLITKKKTDKDLSSFKTYAYLPNANVSVSDSLFNSGNKVAEDVINAMNDNMKALGYSVNRNEPDILIALSTEFNKKRMKELHPVYETYPYDVDRPQSPNYDPYYYYGYSNYGDFSGYNVDYSKYKVGVLTVDIIDRKTRKVIWTGMAKEPIYHTDDTKKIVEFVNEIFDEYPATNSR